MNDVNELILYLFIRIFGLFYQVLHSVNHYYGN